MRIELFDYQKKAVSELKTGSILWGGVGSGKSLTALAYYYEVECRGSIEPEFKARKIAKPLYIITTPRKRDELDWDSEAAYFSMIKGIDFFVDSWNNIGKYKTVKDAFFIFDEQKVVGYGAWVKAFLKIAKANNWILLTATPGDTWMDYLPVFIANGFYRNKSDFTTQHVVYNTYTHYPKVDRYVNEGKLQKLKRQVVVKMDYHKKTVDHIVRIVCPYNEWKFSRIKDDRWNPFKNRPIQTASEYYYAMRQVVNSDPSRFEAVIQLLDKHRKLIVFYNFDYELDILRRLNDVLDIPVAEYNGHLHEPIPEGDSWIYIAQYLSAGEAWNCTQTNAIVLYSRNYSYKQTIQAMGRIDRQNTTFLNLYYYFLTSNSWIDQEVTKAFGKKQNFNENKYKRKDKPWPQQTEQPEQS
jgi:hypothetical protein